MVVLVLGSSYLIQRGSVQILGMHPRNGTPVLLGTAGKSHALGVVDFFLDQRMVRAVTQTPVHMLTFPKDVVQALMRQNTAFHDRLVKRACACGAVLLLCALCASVCAASVGAGVGAGAGA